MKQILFLSVVYIRHRFKRLRLMNIKNEPVGAVGVFCFQRSLSLPDLASQASMDTVCSHFNFCLLSPMWLQKIPLASLPLQGHPL